MPDVDKSTWRDLWAKESVFSHALKQKNTPVIDPRHFAQIDDNPHCITNCTPSTSYHGGTLYAYRVAATKDHLELVNLKPTERSSNENGRFHGQVIRIPTGYRILIGPPISFTLDKTAVEETAVSQPFTAPTPQRPSTSIRNYWVT